MKDLSLSAARLLLSLLLTTSAIGCGDDADPAPVFVVTEMHHEWDGLPHRLSQMELTAALASEGPDEAPEGIDVRAQNNGGEFGFLDQAEARQGFEVWTASNLAAAYGSVLVEIAPSGQIDPETHFAVVDHTHPAPELVGASEVMAFIRGYRVDTNLFDTPPAFASTYDPAAGYTTQGLGIQLGDVTMSGQTASFTVHARNSVGEADRLDLNSIITEVTTWVRVDYVIVGAFGSAESTASATADHEYTLSYADFGMGTVHAHADAATQAMRVTGTPGLTNGLMGITGFDYWLNIPGRIDPTCTVVNQPAEPNVGEGPGRYIKELALNLGGRAYDATAGVGSAELDMLLSNTSNLSEVGNICLGVRGQVGLLQFGGSATRAEATTGTLSLPRPPPTGGAPAPLDVTVELP